MASAAQLEDRSFEFELLLPDAATPLAERSDALFDWCRGFLGRLRPGRGRQRRRCPKRATRRWATWPSWPAAQRRTSGDEDDEDALVEIEEFVRVAVLLLHGDCVLAARHRQRLN